MRLPRFWVLTSEDSKERHGCNSRVLMSKKPWGASVATALLVGVHTLTPHFPRPNSCPFKELPLGRN